MFHHLKLSKPLAILDLETTGTDVTYARIVEFYASVAAPYGETCYHYLVNPTIPIPAGATATHGISDEHVKDRPTFKQLADTINLALAGCDLAGFNILGYDLKLLIIEFKRANVAFDLTGRNVIDVMDVFHRFHPRNLSAAVKEYLHRDHTGAHGAKADVDATADVLDALLGRHGGLPNTVAELDAAMRGGIDIDGCFARDGHGGALFTFGKHKGHTLADVVRTDASYLQWFLGQDFYEDAKLLVREALKR